MLKKRSSIAALLACITLHSVSARNIFVTPGGDPANSSISAFTTDPLSFAGTFASAAGGTQVFAGPGGKYYVIGRVASEGVVVMQGTLQTLQVIKRISTPGIPAGAAISPDGRRLVVVGSGVVVIDTSTDTPISSTVNVGTTPVAVGISSDSKRAFRQSGPAKDVAINLDNAAAAGQADTPGLPTTVNVSPGGLVYVTVQNAIYEFDPQTLEQRGTFSLNGFPGAIAFTPDGKFGITPNLSTVTGRSAFILNLALRTVTDIPSTPFALSKMLFADNNTAFALSTQTTRIYTISVAAPAVPAVYSVPGVTFESVRDITLSNEVPARGLFVLTMAGSLYRVDLTQNVAVGPVTSPLNGTVNYAGPAATGSPNSLLSLNTSQTIAPGGTSLPLIVRALDPQGTPLANVAVTFTISGNGNLTTTSTTTDLLGYAQTVASIPATAANGIATITAAAGGQQAALGITISTNTGGGGGGGGGGTPNTGGLQIVLGQGQVTGQGFPTSQPFTVIVKDSAGTPQPNVPIAWTIVEGSGGLGSPSDRTDANGIATASYANFLVPLGVPFTQATVSASTGTDTVNFIVTTVPRLPSGAPGEATYTLLAPLDRTLNLRAGETLAGAIQIAVGSLTGFPIPNVALRLETDDPAGPQVACRGGVPLSDVNGLVTCDVTATGTIGDTGGRIIVGERVQIAITIHVTAGAASVVRIASGNNQTGNAGQALPNPLIVEVADAGVICCPAYP